MALSMRMPDAQAPSPAHALAARSPYARALAMGGYALVAASLFTVWITGLAAFVVAFLHRKDADPVARSHFRFQLLVADLAGLAVGVGAALAVSGVIFVIGPYFDGDAPTWGDFGGGVGLALLGVLLFVLSFAGTLFGAAFGALRLAQGREVRLFGRRRRG
jgi:uncharacterized membrane protein